MIMFFNSYVSYRNWKYSFNQTNIFIIPIFLFWEEQGNKKEEEMDSYSNQIFLKISISMN